MPTKGSVVRAVRITREDNEAMMRYMAKHSCTFNRAVHLLIREEFGDRQMDITDFIDCSGEKVNDYPEKRLEYERIRGKLPKLLGTTCVRCGSTEQIEYHHKRPLLYGGTNDLSNIIPLCRNCHKEAHGAKGMDREKEELRAENSRLKEKIKVLKAALVAMGE
jgi:5-methylcytosine-specific restriction endonuclease McrA